MSDQASRRGKFVERSVVLETMRRAEETMRHELRQAAEQLAPAIARSTNRDEVERLIRTALDEAVQRWTLPPIP